MRAITLSVAKNVVYIILEENSQDNSSKPYYRTVISEMCALQPNISNLQQCVQKNALNVRKCLKDIVTQ
jgi:hypothetical protein